MASEMQWRRDPEAADGDGVAELVTTAQRQLGPEPLLGTRFLYNTRQMLDASRLIEAAVSDSGGRLLVGFQNASRFEQQHRRYTELVNAGVDVVAFGTGSPRPIPPGMVWIVLVDDPLALENQWFLVTTSPEPVAFVAFETSPVRVAGRGPATSAGRSWSGFLTEDARLVEAIQRYLTTTAEVPA